MSVGLRVDAGDPTPPYEQLRRQVLVHVASGVVTEGARMPPVRQLAADLGVAAGTVARTYKELEASGIVRTARRAGTTVAAGAAELARSSLVVADSGPGLDELALGFVATARAAGAGDGVIEAAVRSALARP